MNQRPVRLRPVAPLPAQGRFPRAQGGWCEFRPAIAMAETPDGANSTLRAIYPPADPPSEPWVRVRW